MVHGREKEEIERLLRRAVSSTISYGYHKDMLIYSILEIAEACQKCGINGVEAWVLSLAPAIAHVDDFTDGDETRYFPQQLGQALASISPSLLPDYYLWLSEQEELFDARAVFQEFIKSADLSDPINRAIAVTGVDHDSLQTLRERAEEGDAVAADLLNLAVAQFGQSRDTNPQATDINLLGEDDVASDKPPAIDFPPPQVNEYLRACGAIKSYQATRYIEVWIKYWDDNGNGLQAYEAIKDLADSGYDVRNGDLIAELARKFAGKEEAYRWITAAHRQGFAWWDFGSSREAAQARWGKIRDDYPDSWFQFIQETITRKPEEPWSDASAKLLVLRLTEYCIAFGEIDQAREIAESVLRTIHELTPSINFATPGWLPRTDPKTSGPK